MWFPGALIVFLLSFSDGKILSEKELKVINGNDAKEGQFPWHVLIITDTTKNNIILCSGAIISRDWVLTSASCINQADDVSVASGYTDFSVLPEIMAIGAQRIIIHEDFKNDTLQNDIGLLKLESSLSFDETTQAISLSKDVVEDGIMATIAGWGHSNKDSPTIDNITPVLQFAKVPTITNSECAKIYGTDVVTSTVICTFNPNVVRGPCINDGGAPLIKNAATDPQHVGIFSFMGENGCEKNYPAGYTRTAPYVDWIKNKTGI
ncbi:chymotrypsin BI-like [Tribolium madens]|uniref:chymotrypsin BI-like n=1 Tax=Tribolium madens TaxID=41895 RepID=UPI001CF720D1|nr:chymotrypsin BI-like [Tribolium madens]